MSRTKRLVIVVTLLVLSIMQAVSPYASAQDGLADGVRLLSADSYGLHFAIDFPASDVRLDPILVGGEEFVRPNVPGWAMTGQAGAPELPYTLTTVAVPAGVKVRLQVEPGELRLLSLPARPAPVATIRASWDWDTLAKGQPGLPRPVRELLPDEAIYGANASYPGTFAEVVSDGLLRQQRVIGIATYPVHYEPSTKTLRVYDNLQMRVVFDAESQPRAVARRSQPESAAFEGVLQAGLLNYQATRQWAAAAPAVPKTAPWTPPEPGYRVYVRETGLYKLAYDDLGGVSGAGLPVDTLDPRTLRLYAGGQEVAIHVEGEGDGLFDQEDYLLFFGEEPESKYSADNVYWLTYGQGPGRRMGVRDGTPAGETTPSMHVRQLHLEQNAIYIPRLTGDEDLERYVWDYVYPPSRPSTSLVFTLRVPSTDAYTGTVTANMFGNLSDSVNPDHHMELYLNGEWIGEGWWDGLAWHEVQGQFDQSLLNAGENTLQVLAPNDTGAGKDLAYVDWVDIEYGDTFWAHNDLFAFNYGLPGTWKFLVDGFTISDIVALDVSDPASVLWIQGTEVDSSGAGFSLAFSAELAEPAAYFVAASSAYLSPERVEPDLPSHLGSVQNRADYLIVTHAAFAEALEPLQDYRTSQGLRVVLVDVQDVYDEFAYGNVGAQAIRSFLEYAYYNWQPPAPAYVLLVGDGHYDPKDYQGNERPSFIPPYLAPVDPWIGETAADNRYVSLTAGDELPDMMLGRMAVNTAVEAATVVSKTLAYEQNPPPGDWNSELLFVADNRDLGGDFAHLSRNVISCCLPDPYMPEEVYYKVTHSTPASVTEAIVSEVSQGKLFVNYIGHAGVTGWAHEAYFLTKHLPSLSNEGRLPVMLPMTCYDGYYHYPFPSWADSMAESIVGIEGKGAVASWAPTGLGVASGHDQLNRGFYNAVFENGVRTLGAAAMAGKLRLAASGGNLDLLDTYLIFGDPALRINALDADLQLEKAVEPSGFVEQGQVLTYTLTFSNTGPAMAHSVVLTDVLPTELVSATVVSASPNVLGQRPGAPFSWDIADLSSGQGGEIQFTATVAYRSQPGPFTIENEAEITMAEPDTDPSNNRDTTSTPVAGQIYGLYLPVVEKRFDPQLYDDFKDPKYDLSYNPDLWDRAGHAGYGIRQWAGTLDFDSGTAPAHTGAEMYLTQPGQRSLSEVQDFEAMLKFDSGQVGGYASVKIQTTADLGSDQGWWMQCTLAAADSAAASIVCDVSTYDGTGDTREYRSPVVAAQFDTWYTVRMEIDPDSAQLSFYVDDALIGTHLPQDAAALKNAKLSPKVGVWNGATGTTATRHVDEVRISPAR